MEKTLTYTINNAEISVQRSFSKDRTVADIILEIISKKERSHTVESQVRS